MRVVLNGVSSHFRLLCDSERDGAPTSFYVVENDQLESFNIQDGIQDDDID